MFIKFKILSANNKYQTRKKNGMWISFRRAGDKGGWVLEQGKRFQKEGVHNDYYITISVPGYSLCTVCATFISKFSTNVCVLILFAG
jgi:hypothetical protein